MDHVTDLMILKDFNPMIDDFADATDGESIKDDDMISQTKIRGESEKYDSNMETEEEEVQYPKQENEILITPLVISTTLSIRFSSLEHSTSGAPSYATTILPDVSSKLSRESGFFREVIQKLGEDVKEPLIRPEILVEVPILNPFLALTFLLEIAQNNQLSHEEVVMSWSEEWATLSALWDCPRYISLYRKIREERLTKFCFSWLQLSSDNESDPLNPGLFVREGTPKNPVVFNGSPSYVIETGRSEKVINSALALTTP